MTFLARLLARSSGEAAVVRPRPALSVLPFAHVEHDVHATANTAPPSTTSDAMSRHSPPVSPPMPRTQPSPAQVAPPRRRTPLVASEETSPVPAERTPRPAHVEHVVPLVVEAVEARAAPVSHEAPRSAPQRPPPMPAATQGKAAARKTELESEGPTQPRSAAAHPVASHPRPTPSPASARSRRPSKADEATRRTEPDTVVHIHIGRIDVRAEAEPSRPAAVRQPPAPRLTLEEYTRQRLRGER